MIPCGAQSLDDRFELAQLKTQSGPYAVQLGKSLVSTTATFSVLLAGQAEELFHLVLEMELGRHGWRGRS